MTKTPRSRYGRVACVNVTRISFCVPMTYESVDQLQRTLTEEVFGYARDSKKAAGRALGTIVEIVTFYLLKTWGLDSSISIETKIPEYGRPEITHNVEFSLHPVLEEHIVEANGKDRSLTANRLLQLCNPVSDLNSFRRTNNVLLSKNKILRNGCRIAQNSDSILIATLLEEGDNETFQVSIAKQNKKPYAMFECKRVGVEEGIRRAHKLSKRPNRGHM